MALLDLLDTLSEGNQDDQKKQCVVGTVLDTLSEPERTKLHNILFPKLGEFRAPATAIGHVLRKSGLSVGDTSVKRHRRRECLCFEGETNE